jgi:hypothetical protein
MLTKNQLAEMFPLGDPAGVRLMDPFSAISAGTSLIGGIIGSSAASRAAKAQAAAGQAAAGAVDKAAGQAIDAGYAGMGQANTAIDTGVGAANTAIGNAGTAQAGIYAGMTGGLQPYQAAGTYGLNKLQSTAGTFSFNPQELQNDPGYQFQLQQGMKALGNSQAARGMLQSGAALKATENYAQGLAGTSYQNAYNRALSTFNTNQQGYLSLAGLGTTANQQAIQAGGIYGGELTSLANLAANTNLQGAGLKSNVAMQGNEYIGNTGLQGAQMAGNFRTGAANAQAAGIMGGANAWSGALSGIGNAAMGAGMMQGLNSMGATGGAPEGFTPYSSGSLWMPSYGASSFIPGTALAAPSGALADILSAVPAVPGA